MIVAPADGWGRGWRGVPRIRGSDVMRPVRGPFEAGASSPPHRFPAPVLTRRVLDRPERALCAWHSCLLHVAMNCQAFGPFLSRKGTPR